MLYFPNEMKTFVKVKLYLERTLMWTLSRLDQELYNLICMAW